MTRDAFGVDDVRAAERVLLDRLPDGALMRRAAAGLAAVCAGVLRERRGRVTGARVVLLVGAGDNGGDALYAGAGLARRGARVDAVLLSGRVHAAGLAALRADGGRVVPPSPAALAGADLVLDGIVGIGGSAGLREPAASLVAAIDRDRGVVVAVDLPSGVSPDSGALTGDHVVADLTVSFGALKPCLLLPPAARAAGDVRLVDLDLSFAAGPAVDRLTDADAGRLWPVPGPDDDKYSRGVVGVVAGSAGYPGAAVLAVGGAVRAGAGMVRYRGPGPAADQVRSHWPEAVVGPGRVQSWVLGSGVDGGDDHDGQVPAILAALGERLPTVLDAGALGLLSRESARALLGPRTVLTPHAGELARLLSAWPDVGPVSRDQVSADPAAHAARAAGLTGATVLLKGSTTVVATPDGRLRTQSEAPAWLATAGAGDVLAGVLGTLLAAGLAPIDAAGLAALVHGRAARLAGTPLLAQDVIAHLPAAVAVLLAG